MQHQNKCKDEQCLETSPLAFLQLVFVRLDLLLSCIFVSQLKRKPIKSAGTQIEHRRKGICLKYGNYLLAEMLFSSI